MLLIILPLLLILNLSNTYLMVKPGEAAVLENRYTGIEEKVLDAGWHVTIPFVHKAVKYSIGLEKLSISSNEESLILETLDGKPVQIELALKFRLQEKNLYKLHRDVGLEYRERVVLTAAGAALREVVSRYQALELSDLHETVGREAFQEELFQLLKSELNNFYIDVDRVEIKDLIVSDR